MTTINKGKKLTPFKEKVELCFSKIVALEMQLDMWM